MAHHIENLRDGDRVELFSHDGVCGKVRNISKHGNSVLCDIHFDDGTEQLGRVLKDVEYDIEWWMWDDYEHSVEDSDADSDSDSDYDNDEDQEEYEPMRIVVENHEIVWEMQRANSILKALTVCVYASFVLQVFNIVLTHTNFSLNL
jgi:hypothetical protein